MTKEQKDEVKVMVRKIVNMIKPGNDLLIDLILDTIKDDPYRELKEAKAAGKDIQIFDSSQGWDDISHPLWGAPVDCYRIKPPTNKARKAVIEQLQNEATILRALYEDAVKKWDESVKEFDRADAKNHECLIEVNQAFERASEASFRLNEAISKENQ